MSHHLEGYTPEEWAALQRRLREQQEEKDRRRREDKSAHAELIRMAEAGDKGAMLCLYFQGRPSKPMLRLRSGDYTHDRDAYERDRE